MIFILLIVFIFKRGRPRPEVAEGSTCATIIAGNGCREATLVTFCFAATAAEPGQAASQALDAPKKGGLVNAQFPRGGSAVIGSMRQGRADGLGIDQFVGCARFALSAGTRVWAIARPP